MHLANLLLSIFLFAGVFVKAQSSTSFSTLLSNDDQQIHFVSTIGDVFVTTLSNNQNTISQGYLQKEMDYVISITEERISEIILYPNPTSGKIYLSLNEYTVKDIDIEQIKVYDYCGKLISISNDLGSLSSLPEIDLSTLNAGIYMIHIYFGNTKQSIRIVKI